MKARRAWFLALAVVALSALVTARAEAFCGFYVSGASGKLYNDATQVVLMRDGTRTVMSMRNHYKGPARDFAMVVPVPQVLEEENVKVIKDSVFDRVDKLAAPRLVEYWEQDPCAEPAGYSMGMAGAGRGAGLGRSAATLGTKGGKPQVRVEAQFDVGEYNVVILSADESNALEEWLLANKYNIPKGAAKVLKGYIEQGMYFFVAKVDAKKVNFDKRGNAQLSPLRFHYDSEDFSLPVRLGLLNARGKQDLIVHVLSKQGRYEVANLPNAVIPTNLVVPKATRRRFAEFYAALFDYTMEQNPGAVVTEYAWSAGKCDPCPVEALNPSELLTLGADVLPGVTHAMRRSARPLVTPRTATADGGLSPEVIERVFRRDRSKLRACHARALRAAGGATPMGEGTFELQLSADGRVLGVRALGGTALEHVGLKICTMNHIRRMVFPAPEGGEGAKATITLNYRLQMPPRVVNASGWTLTRLHARYSAKELEQDLVFRQAPPIVGGRGMPQGADGVLPEGGAEPTEWGMNAFQGRYIMLNRWSKKLTCEEPRRGRWGGPSGSSEASVKAAQGTAFARRGRVKLSKKLREQARERDAIGGASEGEDGSD